MIGIYAQEGGDNFVTCMDAGEGRKLKGWLRGVFGILSEPFVLILVCLLIAAVNTAILETGIRG